MTEYHDSASESVVR